jgi:hypothetical protein
MKKRSKRISKSVLTILFVVVGILILLTLLGLYFVSNYVESCETFECFQGNLNGCTKANYVNEEPEASWGYEIKGYAGNECQINVKLLQVKQGELNLEDLEGFDMDCFYQPGFVSYPEKDLEKCHGRLKEELQTRVIERLHSYILENLGKVDSGLNSAI